VAAGVVRPIALEGQIMAMSLRILSAAVLVLAGTGQALAQGQPPVWGGAQERNFYFALLAGLTGGGDTLAEVRFTNGDSEKIRGGGLLHLGAGVLWQPAQIPFAVQATVGYHVDDVTAENGDITFSRLPLEVIGYYTGIPKWRFGIGPRFVNDARLKINVAGTDTVKFKDTTGLVVEAGYLVTPRFSVNLRYTDEEYEAQSVNGLSVMSTGRTSGRSVGLNLVVAL
jgi:hypothetical protein